MGNVTFWSFENNVPTRSATSSFLFTSKVSICKKARVKVGWVIINISNKAIVLGGIYVLD